MWHSRSPLLGAAPCEYTHVAADLPAATAYPCNLHSTSKPVRHTYSVQHLFAGECGSPASRGGPAGVPPGGAAAPAPPRLIPGCPGPGAPLGPQPALTAAVATQQPSRNGQPPTSHRAAPAGARWDLQLRLKRICMPPSRLVHEPHTAASGLIMPLRFHPLLICMCGTTNASCLPVLQVLLVQLPLPWAPPGPLLLTPSPPSAPPTPTCWSPCRPIAWGEQPCASGAMTRFSP